MKIETGTIRPSNGFSLAELLVSVGIIGVLACLALPAYSKAQHEVRKTQCKANQRGTYTVLMSAYSQFPSLKEYEATRDSDIGSHLLDGSRPDAYLGDLGFLRAPLMNCPGIPQGKVTYFSEVSRLGNKTILSTYLQNGAFSLLTGSRDIQKVPVVFDPCISTDESWTYKVKYLNPLVLSEREVTSKPNISHRFNGKPHFVTTFFSGNQRVLSREQIYGKKIN